MYRPVFLLIGVFIVIVEASTHDIPIKYLHGKKLETVATLALNVLNNREQEYRTRITTLRGAVAVQNETDYRVDLVVAKCEEGVNCDKDQLENAELIGLVYRKDYSPEEFLHVKLLDDNSRQ